MIKLISLLLITAQPVYADQAIKVHTGDVVKPEFDQGTLLDAQKADKIRDQLIDGDACQKEKESFQKSIELYRQNETLYTEQKNILLNSNIELSKALNESRSTSNWERLGYVLLGIGITAVAVKGAASLK